MNRLLLKDNIIIRKLISEVCQRIKFIYRVTEIKGQVKMKPNNNGKDEQQCQWCIDLQQLFSY